MMLAVAVSHSRPNGEGVTQGLWREPGIEATTAGSSVDGYGLGDAAGLVSSRPVPRQRRNCPNRSLIWQTITQTRNPI